MKAAADPRAAAPKLPARNERRRADAEHLIAIALRDPDLTSASLCRELGLSRSTLYRIFEGEGGVEAYIRDLRLDKVCQLLMTGTGDLKIYKVAEAWHFSDSSHVTRLFKRKFGLIPKAAARINHSDS